MDREPTDQEILDILQEECAEIIHIISKIRRFGIDNILQDGYKTNSKKLSDEINDTWAMINWAVDRGLIERVRNEDLLAAIREKQDKVRRYCGEYTDNK